MVLKLLGGLANMLNDFLHKEKGSTVLFILLLLPVIFYMMLIGIEHGKAVHSLDAQFQYTCNEATRAASLQVDPLSQAYNNPMINSERAHLAFRKMLALNLKLNESTLAPLDGSEIRNISYSLIVVNGVNTYGLVESIRYDFNGILTSEENTFNINDTIGITEEGDINIGTAFRDVILDRPGCIAVVKADIKSYFGDEDIEAVRWSASKIIGE